MQAGGAMPKQSDYPDHESWQQALEAWMMSQSQLPPINVPMSPIMENEIVRPPDEQSLPEMDRVQEGITRGIIESPKGYSSAQELYDYVNSPASNKRQPSTPKNWRQNLGVGIMALRTLGSEISGRVARARQNQYDYMQQTALGMMNPMPTTDYQPNPYSLYAKYGGSLKKYGGLQHHEYFGPPFSNGATYKFSDAERYDKMLLSRKIMPKMLLNRSRYATGGIHIKPENRGKFTDYCGGKVTNDCIQKGLNSPSAVIRKRANFARNARKWKEEGGKMDYKGGGLTPNKAREILHDGTAHGHPLTDKQRRFFGAKSKGHTNYRGK